MKRSYLYFLIVLSIFFNSCENNAGVVILEETSLEAILSVPNTIKLARANDETDSLTVNVTDESLNDLSVWYVENYVKDYNILFNKTSNTDNQHYEYKGLLNTWKRPSNELYLIYPNIEGKNMDLSYVSLKIPSVQVQNGILPELGKKAYFLGRSTNEDYVAGVVKPSISYPWSVLHFNINLQGVPSHITNHNLINIKFLADEGITGNMIYDLQSQSITYAPKGKSLELTFSNRIIVDTNIEAYGVVRPVDLSKGNNSITIYTDRGYFYIPLTFTHSLEGNMVYDMNINVAQLMADNLVKFRYYPKDLSVEGNANSYIVTEPGLYSYKATQGNSSTLLNNVAKVDWLWASEQGLISDIEYESGNILFEASDKRGNAVIAAFDANDNIIWTWHIWMTDDPRLDLHRIQNSDIMDRNLGATSKDVENVNSYGLYYQWGRKDPFPGAKIIGSKANGSTLNMVSETSAFGNATITYVMNPLYESKRFSTIGNNNSNIPAGQAVAYAIANPTKFIFYSGQVVNGSSTFDWLNGPQQDNLWGFTGDYFGPAKAKSIYDPCPAGYRVPHTGSHVFWTWAGTAIPQFSASGFKGLNTTRGFTILMNGKTYYYPASGHRGPRNGQLTDVGNQIWMWSSTRSDAADNNKWGGRASRWYRFGTDEYYYNATERAERAYGLPCRCIKE